MWLIAILCDMLSGREQLQAWIERRFSTLHGKQSEAARLLGLDQSYLSQLLGGRRQPGLRTAVSIERLTGIPVEAWLPTADGPQSEPVTVLAAKCRDGKE